MKLSKFEVNLAYKVSSEPAWATEWDPNTRKKKMRRL